CQHHNTYFLIRNQGIKSGLKSLQHLARQQVHLLRPVHGQRADGVALIAQQERLSGLRNGTHVSMALVDLAFSRSRNFWILPVEVFGSSPKTTARGALNPARWPRNMISPMVSPSAGTGRMVCGSMTLSPSST